MVETQMEQNAQSKEHPTSSGITIAQSETTAVVGPAPSPKRYFAGQGLHSVWLWAALGLGGMFCFMLGKEPGAPESPLWFMEFVLIGSFLTGLYFNTKNARVERLRLRPRYAVAAYIALAWFAGMTYELTISTTHGNIGGCAPTTVMSFLVAQFSYVPLILFSLLLIRMRHLGFTEAFFFGGGASFIESMVFRPMLLLVLMSPLFFLAPLVLGYFLLVYGMFSSFPLLFIDERDLWSKAAPGPTPLWMVLLLGILAGFGAALTFGLGGGALEWILGAT